LSSPSVETGRGMSMNRVCPYCGRTWTIIGRQSGFISSGSERHVERCVDRTPQERGQVNRRDLKKWEKNPPNNLVVIPESHPGVQANIAEKGEPE
jgi:hypothetical protein